MLHIVCHQGTTDFNKRCHQAPTRMAQTQYSDHIDAAFTVGQEGPSFMLLEIKSHGYI